MRLRGRLDFPDRHEETVQPWLWVRLILLGLAIAYLIAFAIDNDEESKIDFVFGSAQVSRVWLILISVAIGLLAGLLLSQLYRHRQRRRSLQRTGEPVDAGPDLAGGDEAVGEPR
jgi:uncharacterized integral membrane protein